MANKFISGKITFIHHEKKRAVIEYIDNEKKKTIQADIDEKAQARLVEDKIIKKQRRFLIGDHVKFLIRKPGPNGKILYAESVQYQYNTTLEILINKAATENKFLGYIKMTDNEYFIKEIESYLFFPLKISAYEIPPGSEQMQKPVYFKLVNINTPEKMIANLYNHNYIPEFLAAIQYFKKQAAINATVTKITSYGIYLALINEKIQSKLTITKLLAEKIADKSLIIGSIMQVKISHLSADRIVVKPTEENL